MRISCHRDHPDYRPDLVGKIMVLLDGKPVELCTYADTESGFVRHAVRGEDGILKTQRQVVKDDYFPRLKIENVTVELVAYGRVEIVRRHRNVEVIREIQPQPVPYTEAAAPVIARALRVSRAR